MRKLVKGTLDRPDDGGKAFTELQPGWAPSMVIGFGRLGGRAVGVLANKPMRMGGCLDSESAEKESRFGAAERRVRSCCTRSQRPPSRGSRSSPQGLRGTYIAMNSRSLGATSVFAWPNAEVAVMGAEAAVGILHRRTLAAAADDDRPAVLIAEHERTIGGLPRAVELGAIDEIIDPADTRARLVRAPAAAPARGGTHANIPL